MPRLRRTPPDVKTWHREVLPYIDALRLEIIELRKQNQGLTQEKAALEIALADEIERHLDREDLLRKQQ